MTIVINRRILSFPPGQSVFDDSPVANSGQKGLQRNRELAGISPPNWGMLSRLSANAEAQAADQIRHFFTSSFWSSQGGVREVEVNCGSYSDRRAYK
jgi:hypothetical protein